VDDNEQAVWDDFYGTLVGWTYHPGYYRENATKPTLHDCAEMADEMMIIRRERINMRRQRDG
jgi:hypothetical protein